LLSLIQAISNPSCYLLAKWVTSFSRGNAVSHIHQPILTVVTSLLLPVGKLDCDRDYFWFPTLFSIMLLTQTVLIRCNPADPSFPIYSPLNLLKLLNLLNYVIFLPNHTIPVSLQEGRKSLFILKKCLNYYTLNYIWLSVITALLTLRTHFSAIQRKLIFAYPQPCTHKLVLEWV